MTRERRRELHWGMMRQLTAHRRSRGHKRWVAYAIRVMLFEEMVKGGAE